MFGDVLISVLGFLILVVSKTAILWGPILLGYIAFQLWHHYVNERFIGGIEWTLLEVEIPREITKTPLAMELFFTNAFYHMSVKGVWEEYWQGAMHFWFSLEIVSIDGKVHFFIRTPSRIKKLVETQLYAQYPQVRVTEVEDYTLPIPRYKEKGNWYLWGCEFKLEKPDFFKIKTYADYGLDKAGQKEEDKIDPITSVIEFMGSLERGQQLWMQFIIRPTKKKFHIHGYHGHPKIYEAADEYIKEVLLPYTQQKLGLDGLPGPKEIRIPDFMKKDIESIKEKITKTCFDVGIRIVNLADKRIVSLDTFNNTRRSSRLLFRQYADPDTNSFDRFNSTQFDYPFSDPTGRSIELKKGNMLSFYKLRTMYYPPLLVRIQFSNFLRAVVPLQKPEYFVLNVEELATIFHFPGMVSETPSFRRLDTKTAKPPANLPL